jgi:hypothetical protein
VTVGGGRVDSTTHVALAVFLPLALRGGLGGLVRAGAGGGDVNPDALIGAAGVLNCHSPALGRRLIAHGVTDSHYRQGGTSEYCNS